MDCSTTSAIVMYCFLPLAMMVLLILPISGSAFSASALTTMTSRRAFILSSLSLPSSPFGSLFSSTSSDNALFDFGPYRDGTVQVSRGDDKKQQLFSLYYRLYHPDSDQIPMVICHGGPSLPSQYLYPLVPLLKERPVLFFDQLGCGKSDEPKNLSYYSVPKTVQDLETVVAEVLPDRPKFHLYGHSFGGMVAYDYYCMHYNSIEHGNNAEQTTRQRQPQLASLILSNAPTNFKLGGRIYDELQAKNPKTFWQDHVCKVGMPPILQDALAHTGSPQIWAGMDAVPDLVAKPNRNSQDIPPTLILSASRDFAYQVSNEQAWREVLLPSLATEDGQSHIFSARKFDDCSHYPFYEDGPRYGETIDEFLATLKV